MPDAGHFPFQAAPDVFNSLLIEVAQNITRFPLTPAADEASDPTGAGAGTQESPTSDQASHAHAEAFKFVPHAVALVCICTSVLLGSV